MGVRDITSGVKGWQLAGLVQHPANATGYGRRTVDAFHDPEDFKTLKKLSVHLCEGMNSPCETCEILCGYGRRCLELRKKEAAVCSV